MMSENIRDAYAFVTKQANKGKKAAKTLPDWVKACIVIITAIAIMAGICFAIYAYFNKRYLDEFNESMDDDDFEMDEFDEEDELEMEFDDEFN